MTHTTMVSLFLSAVALSLTACVGSPQFRDSSTQDPPSVELTSTPFHPQKEFQCGPAALATILGASGITVDPDDLAQDIFLPRRRGSVAVEVIASARAHGRLPYPIDQTPDALWAEIAAGRPVMVLQNLGVRSWPIWHYAVVIGYDAKADRVLLRSGTSSRKRLTLRTFYRTWSYANKWGLVLLNPGSLPERADLTRYMAAASGFEATNNFPAAEAAYAVAHDRWPRSSLPVFGLANLAYLQHDWRRAQTFYEEVIALEPTHAIAHNNLADTLAQRGCKASARRIIERAFELTTDATLRTAFADTATRIDSLPNSECAAKN